MLTSFLQDKQLTIALDGEIDHHSAQRIMQQIGGKIDQFLPASCILDFERVSFMDSSGIAVVLNARRRMNELGGSVILLNVQPQPMKILCSAGIEQIAKIS
ncbi:MAG: anti-sigma factor antagonist [Oscillospiraceae bacterium]|nr:anti-sigma factor antagonist [Oscillospiraceae bacterium]